jgi:hypothetical protein
MAGATMAVSTANGFVPIGTDCSSKECSPFGDCEKECSKDILILCGFKPFGVLSLFVWRKQELVGSEVESIESFVFERRRQTIE